jgi:flagellar hook-associated protein 2
MDRVYNNLISAYLMSRPASSKKSTRVHGDKELANHYNDIIKSSKNAPMYIVRLNDDTQEYVLGLKELSLGIDNAISGYFEKCDENFNKIAVTTSDDSIEAKILSEDSDLPEDMDINVNSMATPQINRGNEYYSDGRGLPGGTYEFKANVEGREYKFRYTLGDKTRNNLAMRNLSNSINGAHIGVRAEVKRTDEGKIYMQLSSEDTGDAGMQRFEFEDVSDRSGIVSYYGLNRKIQDSVNANIDINGINYSHPSNSFVLNDGMEIDIKGIAGEPVHVGYKKDSSAVFDSVDSMLEQYNGIIDMSNEYKQTSGVRNSRMRAELNSLYAANSMALGAAGIVKDEDGRLTLDRDTAETAFQSGIFEEVMGKYSEFLDRLSTQVNKMALNPMDYVNKLMVAYPNYNKEGYAHPYMTSMYSGMLFNYYC